MARSLIAALMMWLISVPARGDEMWFCTTGDTEANPSWYFLHGTQLTKVGLPGFYSVLADNKFGIVAVSAIAVDPPKLDIGLKGKKEVGSYTIAIDRETGMSSFGSVDVYGPIRRYTRGRCQPKAEADWPVGFSKSGEGTPTSQ